MTREEEEAVKILKSKTDGSVDMSYEWAETVRMAIEALKAPTKSTNTPTDTPTGFISKEDVKWQIQEWINELTEAIDMLDSIPSADKPKTGKWILDPNGMDWNISAWRCSECGFVATHIGVEPIGRLGDSPLNWAGSKFCPQCGVRITGYER